MILNASWTDDCCGKKDYDGEILSVSTRYWPRGGSAMVFNSARPQEGLVKHDDGSKPSATSSILLRGDFEDQDDPEDDGGGLVLITEDFEGETLEEVQSKVETWAQAQYDKAEAALREAFKKV